MFQNEVRMLGGWAENARIMRLYAKGCFVSDQPFICPGQAKGCKRYNTSFHSVADSYGYSREGLPCLVAEVIFIHFRKLLLVLFDLS